MPCSGGFLAVIEKCIGDGEKDRDFQEPSDREGLGIGIGSEDTDQSRDLAVLEHTGKNNLQVFVWAEICDIGAILSEGRGLTTCWIPQRGHRKSSQARDKLLTILGISNNPFL